MIAKFGMDDVCNVDGAIIFMQYRILKLPGDESTMALARDLSSRIEMMVKEGINPEFNDTDDYTICCMQGSLSTNYIAARGDAFINHRLELLRKKILNYRGKLSDSEYQKAFDRYMELLDCYLTTKLHSNIDNEKVKRNSYFSKIWAKVTGGKKKHGEEK